MEVFRISKFKRARDLSGFGASLKGQRWNRRGTQLLYTASHRSLALLEILVHIGENYPEEAYAITTLEVPDTELITLNSSELPENWHQIFEPGLLATYTEDWLKNDQSVALGVPSAIIPQELNYLLNPLHPNFQDIKIIDTDRFNFDQRFFKDVI